MLKCQNCSRKNKDIINCSDLSENRFPQDSTHVLEVKENCPYTLTKLLP